MNIRETSKENSLSEVNLKFLIEKIFRKKFLFAISILFCLSAAFAYLKIATPKYLVQTSLLIDSSGGGRSMGSSKYVDGEVGLIGMKKNLFNEMGIVKSYGLIHNTLQDLDFEVSYFAGPWYKKTEYYGDFPFKVILVDSTNQLKGAPFNIEILSDEKYRLSVKANKFDVFNTISNNSREISTGIDYSGEYNFGETVEHDYFQFIIDKTTDNILNSEFEDQELSFKINSLSGLANSYLNKLDVQQLDIQASILTIESKGSVVAKEISFLNKLNDNFIRSKYAERTEVASSKEDFIQKQLKGITDSLSKAERRLEQFKRGTNSVDLTRTGAIGLDQLQQLESEKGQIELNVKYYTSLLQYIYEQDGINKVIAPSAVGIDDPLLNENLLELKRLNTEMTRLSFVRGRKSVDLKLLRKQINNTTDALKENIRNLIKSSRLALREKNQKIVELERSLNRLPGNEKKLLNFERKANLYGNLFNYLSQELAKTGIARAEDVADTKVLDEPRQMGDGPVAPQKLLIMALGGIVGFMLPMFLVVFSNTSEEIIYNDKHLEELSPIPVVAKIFHAKQSANNNSQLAAQSQLSESFRDLAANMRFLLPDLKSNIIGITSNISGEGKTFCASNLGKSLACEGKRVLLIDLNFRNPQLLNLNPKEKDAELSGYLDRDNLEIKNIVYTSEELPSLHYIPTYPKVTNPHKFLSNPKLATLLQTLSKEYDYVIVDTAPVGLVSDYLLISKLIDIHLFVMRRKVSKFSFLKDIERLRVRGNMKNSLLVFNGCKPSSFRKRSTYMKSIERESKSISVSKKVKKPFFKLLPLLRAQIGKK